MAYDANTEGSELKKIDNKRRQTYQTKDTEAARNLIDGIGKDKVSEREKAAEIKRALGYDDTLYYRRGLDEMSQSIFVL